MNINWNNKPEWAIGAGYSDKYNDWLWFDHSHYMAVNNSSVVYPFNNSFSKDDMAFIELACDNQTKQHDIDWSKKPDWADGYGIIDRNDKAIWFNDEKFMYLNTGDTFKCMNIALNNKIRDIQYPPSEDDLPSVGTKCLMFVGERMIGDQVLIMGYYDDLVWVTVQSWDRDGDYSGFHQTYVINDRTKFQPVKTDKELWIEEALCLFPTLRPALSTIYDEMIAGSLRIPKGEMK